MVYLGRGGGWGGLELSLNKRLSFLLLETTINSYLTRRSSESSTVGPRELWLIWAADSADLGSCKSVDVAGKNV